MKTTSRRFGRLVNLVTATLLLAISIVPLFGQTSHAAAGGLVQSRSIQLSNSVPSATGVTYNVSFKPTVTNTIGGIVVDFCSDSPIIYSTACVYPAGFTLGTTATVSGLTGFSTSTGSWVTTNSLQCGAPATNKQVLLYTNTTAQTPTGTSTAINFQITGVTNTSATGSFYARIYTFDTSADTTAGYTCSSANVRATASSTTGLIDYGGDALSTAAQINISATVQETLQFCVASASITANCANAGANLPSITIGTGSPAVLDTTGEGTPVYTQLSTNASHGVAVNMKATNACTNGGLSTAPPDIAGGCASITGIGANGVLTAGTWGVCVAPGAGVTAVATYKDTTNSCPTSFNATSEYGMVGANVTSTYGDQVYSTAGAVSGINSSLTFAAKAASTTPAGVYQGGEQLIATGTF